MAPARKRPLMARSESSLSCSSAAMQPEAETAAKNRSTGTDQSSRMTTPITATAVRKSAALRSTLGSARMYSAKRPNSKMRRAMPAAAKAVPPSASAALAASAAMSAPSIAKKTACWFRAFADRPFGIGKYKFPPRGDAVDQAQQRQYQGWKP